MSVPSVILLQGALTYVEETRQIVWGSAAGAFLGSINAVSCGFIGPEFVPVARSHRCLEDTASRITYSGLWHGALFLITYFGTRRETPL